jgi:hypothetical protein
VKGVNGKEERKEVLRTELPRIVFPERFQLPLSPHMIASGLLPDKCRVMNSKKLPLWLVFNGVAADSGGRASMLPAPAGGAGAPPAAAQRNISVLFKAGDDLRQDQLTLQILGVMDAFWKAEGLDLCMNPYRCVSTGDELGMIEVVTNSNTLANIVAESIEGGSGWGRKLRAAMQVYSKDLVYKEWILAQEQVDVATMEHNFMGSCAGYCVATYVLGIGDRHNDNLMLTKDGKLFHIDFGHVRRRANRVGGGGGEGGFRCDTLARACCVAVRSSWATSRANSGTSGSAHPSSSPPPLRPSWAGRARTRTAGLRRWRAARTTCCAATATCSSPCST